MTQKPAHTSSHTDGTRRRPRLVLAVMVVLGFLLGAMVPVAAAAAPDAKPAVKLRVKVAKAPYSVGERPKIRVKVKVKRAGRALPAKGRVIVKALGERLKKKVKVRQVKGSARGKGKASVRVRLPELTEPGRVKVRVIFKARNLPTRKVTKRLRVQAAAWEVPDAALRAQIRAALGLPEDHALTLDDAADLNNTNGAALWFGDVRTAAGLELATNLTVLDDYTAGNAQDSRGLDNIVRVNGDFWISNAVQDANYPRLAYVSGEIQAFNVSTERIRSISMPELVDAEGLRIENRPQLATIALPKLATVRGDISIDDDPALAAVELPALTTVGDSLLIDDLDVATAVRLPSLSNVVTLYLTSAPRVQVLHLSSLARVNGNLQVSGLPLLGGLSAPVLQQVAGDVTFYGLGSITTLRFPALQFSHGRVSFGIGEDFPVMPRDGSAVSFPAFDVNQATGLDFSVKGATPQSAVLAERWQEFLTHFGVVAP